MNNDLLIQRSASLSDCGLYRYRLERSTGLAGKIAAGIMVDPTVDAETDDHTIRKSSGFAGRLGVSRFIIGNKFAFRATDIRELRDAPDPIGPENDTHLEQIMRDADLHIVAWGPLGKLPLTLRTPWHVIMRIADRVGCPLYCFGTALDGQLLHPLTLGYDRQLVRWRQPLGDSGMRQPRLRLITNGPRPRCTLRILPFPQNDR